MRYWDPPPLQELRLRTFDTYQKLVPRPLMESSPAIILDIDEPSLSAFGQWPWPRTLIADIVTRLSKLGAAAVAFDIIFAEPDRVSPNLVAGSLAGLDDETREKLLRLPSNDQVLAAAMRETRVILGQSVVHVPDPQTQTRPPTSRLGMRGRIQAHSSGPARAWCRTCRSSSRLLPDAACSPLSRSPTASCAAYP